MCTKGARARTLCAGNVKAEDKTGACSVQAQFEFDYFLQQSRELKQQRRVCALRLFPCRHQARADLFITAPKTKEEPLVAASNQHRSARVDAHHWPLGTETYLKRSAS